MRYLYHNKITQGVPEVGKVAVNHSLWHGRFDSYSWDLTGYDLSVIL